MVNNASCGDGGTFDVMTVLFGILYYCCDVKISLDHVFIFRMITAALDSCVELIFFSIQNAQFFAADSADIGLFAMCCICAIAHWLYFIIASCVYDSWKDNTLYAKLGLKLVGLCFDIFMLVYAIHMYIVHDDSVFNLISLIIEGIEVGLDFIQLLSLFCCIRC
jgi:uncharacterized membrane-anchored protein